jgi:hypothetical protein
VKASIPVLRLLAGAALTLLICSPASALGTCLPIEVEPHSAYRYFDAFSTALGYVKIAVHEADSVGAGKSGSLVEYAANKMTALRLGRSDLECAMACVAPYIPPPELGTHKRLIPADTSWDAKRVEMIGAAARGAFAALAALVRVQDRSIVAYEGWLNDPGATKPGTMARQAAEINDAQHKAMMMLFNSGIAVTWTVVEPDAVTGKMSRLALTASERDDILSTLRTFFGETALDDNSDPDPEIPTATAGVLYHFLKEPGRTVRSAD